MSLLTKRHLLPKLLKYLKQRDRTVLRLNHTQVLPLFASAKKFSDKIAVCDITGRHTFKNIYASAQTLSSTLSKLLDAKTSERVLFLCSNDANYVVVLWAIWMSGQIAVPLSSHHPQSVLEYYASDTNSKLLVTTPEHQDVMKNLSKKTNTSLHVIDKVLDSTGSKKYGGATDSLPLKFYEDNNALILYTSGTTGLPKGVVLSHRNLSFQTNCLLKAWKWSPDDVILHTLPLHHVHGTVNALFCPLAIGATTVMLPKFSAEEVWSLLLGTNKKPKITIFMAVPTIYSKLIDEHKRNHQNQKDSVRSYLQNNVRLMVSGSAPLPTPLYEKWLEISGHRLLERYGMTEIGMCLSNEYDSDRSPGYVGVPLPGVSIRLSENTDGGYGTLLECKNDNGTIVFDRQPNASVRGELLVKGDGVFKEYFNKPEATKKEFTEDGWFKTGDVCEYSNEANRFRMLGRTSVDIIKSGGYKISALQIETILLAHPDIKECAVVGLKDDVWGEKVAAVVVLAKGSNLELDAVREWAKERMPKYSLPTVMRVVGEIPKNAMGKVNKKELVQSVFK